MIDATRTERRPAVAVVGIVVSLALAVGVAVLRAVNAEPVERSAELAGNVAFGLVFAGPAALAVLGLRRRRALLVAAGAMDLVLAFFGLLSIGLAFVVPAVLFFVAAGRVGPSEIAPARQLAAVVAVTALGTLAFLALFQRDDAVCWATIGSTGEQVRLDPGPFVHDTSIGMDSGRLPAGATESGCTTDSISTIEAATSVALLALMLVVSWVVTTPGRPRRVGAAVTG